MMNVSVLTALVILITLPLSFGFVKLISLIYSVRGVDAKKFARYVQRRQRYQQYFD